MSEAYDFNNFKTGQTLLFNIAKAVDQQSDDKLDARIEYNKPEERKLLLKNLKQIAQSNIEWLSKQDPVKYSGLINSYKEFCDTARLIGNLIIGKKKSNKKGIAYELEVIYFTDDKEFTNSNKHSIIFKNFNTYSFDTLMKGDTDEVKLTVLTDDGIPYDKLHAAFTSFVKLYDETEEKIIELSKIFSTAQSIVNDIPSYKDGKQTFKMTTPEEVAYFDNAHSVEDYIKVGNVKNKIASIIVKHLKAGKFSDVNVNYTDDTHDYLHRGTGTDEPDLQFELNINGNNTIAFAEVKTLYRDNALDNAVKKAHNSKHDVYLVVYWYHKATFTVYYIAQGQKNYTELDSFADSHVKQLLVDPDSLSSNFDELLNIVNTERSNAKTVENLAKMLEV